MLTKTRSTSPPARPFCPLCGSRAEKLIRGRRVPTVACKGNHRWHTCPIHLTTNTGDPQGESGCTCFKASPADRGAF